MDSNNKVKQLSHNLGAIFLASGVILFAASYFLTSQILAFLGLGLSFWGALLFLITPVPFVEGEVMVNTLSSSYITTERILKDLDCKGKAFHIPPYPQGTYLPEHLKGLKEMVVFIPKEAEISKPPSLDELAEGKFLLRKPKGILLTPPGLGLLSSIEKKAGVDFTKLETAEVCKSMPKHILEDYSLAKDIVMTPKENEIDVKITRSLYSGFYTEKMFEKSVAALGCPIVSSIACALAKSSAKPVYIQKISLSPEDSTVEAHFKVQVD